jgi:serine/threonine-protein kinase
MSQGFFTTGGTLRHDSPSYVERGSDHDLFEGLVSGEFCYVLTSRQMGKSSLMVRTANKLRNTGARAVVLDLTAIGQNLTPEQWYDGLLMRIGRQLGIEDELEEFWLARERLGPLQRWLAALQEVVLAPRPSQSAPARGPSPAQSAPSRLVLFIDEIDTVRSLPFSTDEFFAAIRECYNRRIEEPEFQQLTFCLLGVATPAELIRDPRITPFNIGRRIELRDFTPSEALPLAEGLAANSALTPLEARCLLDRILHWTHGHPYLTQRLCRAVHEVNAWRAESLAQPPPEPYVAPPSKPSPETVDQLCDKLFLGNRARERDDNLLFVRERLLRSEVDLGALLKLYQRILKGWKVHDIEDDPLVDAFRLSGITRVENDCLRVRNRIYEKVFDDAWIQFSIPPPAKPEPKSIAVLPFANLSRDPDNEFLSDGITEDLISALAQIDGLRVPSRTSAFVFKGRNEDVRKIGAQLKVSSVLEGTVRQAGQKLRVTAQLTNVADGFQIWSERYDRLMDDVFTIQDEISQSIVEALKVKLAESGTRFLVKRYTENAEAYQLYLKGRYSYFKWTTAGFHRSVEFFEEAIALQPDYALAYAGLAESYSALWYFGDSSPRQAVPRAAIAAEKALALDESLAEAHSAMARFRCFYDWQWADAERHFKRAIELDPSYVTAHEQYAFYLTAMGRFVEAIAEGRRAQELDPLSLVINLNFGWIFWFAGQYDQVLDLGRKMLEFEPNFFGTRWLLAAAYGALNQFDNSISEFQKALQLGGGPLVLARLGYVHGLAGNSAAAREILERLHALAEKTYVPSYCLALVHAGLADSDAAIHALESAVRERNANLVYLRVDPVMKLLQQDPRFGAILTSVGLAPA